MHPAWGIRYETLVRAMRAFRERIEGLSMPEQRAQWERIQTPSPAMRRVRVETQELGGVVCRVVEPRARPDGLRDERSLPTILYFHGGAYAFGSFRTHGALAARLSLDSGCRVVFPEYRLAPEHPFPAAIDDARAVYDACTRAGARVAIGGDSAGGGIAVALCVLAREERLPTPTGAVLLSPFVDHLSWDAHPDRLRLDWLTPAWGQGFSRAYVGSQAADHPHISPSRARLSGLPPLLVQIGDGEILYEQVMEFVDRARAAGVDVDLDVEQGMAHSYQLFADIVPHCAAAVTRAARFLSRSLKETGETARRVAPEEARGG
jgi:acetyl esterase/lipase